MTRFATTVSLTGEGFTVTVAQYVIAGSDVVAKALALHDAKTLGLHDRVWEEYQVSVEAVADDGQ